MALKGKHKLIVWQRDNWRCVYCTKKVLRPTGMYSNYPDMATVDHVKPKAAGGNSRIENLVTACYECNQDKGSTYPLEGEGWALGRWQPSSG